MHLICNHSFYYKVLFGGYLQYAAPLHLSSGTLMEDEKLAALGLSDQLPSAQGLLQGQSPFPVTQVW